MTAKNLRFLRLTLHFLGELLRTQGSTVLSVKLLGFLRKLRAAVARRSNRPVVNRHVVNRPCTCIPKFLNVICDCCFLQNVKFVFLKFVFLKCAHTLTLTHVLTHHSATALRAEINFHWGLTDCNCILQLEGKLPEFRRAEKILYVTASS